MFSFDLRKERFTIESNRLLFLLNKRRELVKISWCELVSRIRELESSEFSKERRGVIRRQSRVTKVRATPEGTVIIFLACGKAYVFLRKITWAFLTLRGDIVLRREGEVEGTIFNFRLLQPFRMKEMPEEERYELSLKILNRL